MQRTVLNRLRRGYATKERVQRHVPFLVSDPIGLVRSQFLTSINCYHHYSHHIISIILILKSYNSRVSEALDFYRYYSTKQSVRSYTTSYDRISRNSVKAILPHATRHQTISINLMHKQIT